MHELSIAQGILEIAEQYLPPGNNPVVKSVKVKVGAMSGVVPDSLEFCFSAITTGTRLQGAVLEIDHVELTARCKSCSTVFRVDDRMFVCPACNGTDVMIMTGHELQVTELELLDEGGS
jgi:hydrogenase nickel incorporation protein HypA/HybF